jgi:hypothetical protein
MTLNQMTKSIDIAAAPLPRVAAGLGCRSISHRHRINLAAIRFAAGAATALSGIGVFLTASGRR